MTPKVFRITYDGISDFVEAPTMTKAVEVWHEYRRSKDPEWDKPSTPEPDECSLVHDEPVVKAAAQHLSPARLRRRDVYAALDSERGYQDLRWPGHRHSWEEWIIYIEAYLGKARHLLSHHSSALVSQDVSDIFRKVVAMGVCALEEHGVRPRPKEDFEMQVHGR